MIFRSLLATGLAGSASAVKLLVAGYGPGDGSNGTVTTLELTTNRQYGGARYSASLAKVAAFTGCNPATTWLDTSLRPGKVICLDEGFTDPNKGSIYTLDLARDGSLSVAYSAVTLNGPVASKIYINTKDHAAIALAHYYGSAISTFKLTPDGAFTPLQNFSYHGLPHGPTPDQLDSHVHHVVQDPTSQFLVFPDLGLDKVHVFSIDKSSSKIVPLYDIASPSGSGPRHATFWKSGDQTFLYIVHELINAIISYKVTYPSDGNITFTQVEQVSVYGNRTTPEGARAAEITISPDNRFLIASNRNATIFDVPNPDATNSTKVPSDSLVTFRPHRHTGKLQFVQLAPCYGSFPRHFSLNARGDLLAVANQNSYDVFILERNVRTGIIGESIASVGNLPGRPAGGLTNVRWIEDGYEGHGHGY